MPVIFVNREIRILFFTVTLLICACAVHAQGITAEKLLSSLTVHSLKFDDWAVKKRFLPSPGFRSGDTMVREYVYKPEIKKKKPVDSVMRRLVLKEWKEDSTDEFTVGYVTSSPDEFTALIKDLKTTGFYCNAEADPLTTSMLFQYKDMTVLTGYEKGDSADVYRILISAKNFPDPKDLYFADDLLCFTSHEYLAYYFGEENVKKDFYYFSGDDLANCSVLYPNTSRQVVFIWKDELNRRGIHNLLFGSQQKLKNSSTAVSYVAENNWVFKSGIRPGMTLYQLRLLNGSDLSFYGGGSLKSGMVIPQPGTKLDFDKEEIMLSCVNCGDNDSFGRAEIVRADDALQYGKIVFVLSVILNPGSTHSRKTAATVTGSR